MTWRADVVLALAMLSGPHYAAAAEPLAPACAATRGDGGVTLPVARKTVADKVIPAVFYRYLDGSEDFDLPARYFRPETTGIASPPARLCFERA